MMIKTDNHREFNWSRVNNRERGRILDKCNIVETRDLYDYMIRFIIYAWRVSGVVIRMGDSTVSDKVTKPLMHGKHYRVNSKHDEGHRRKWVY